MCVVLSNNRLLKYMAWHVKKHTLVLVIKSCNSKSLNLIFTKKYTDRLTFIRNNYVYVSWNLDDMWFSSYCVTCGRHTDHRRMMDIWILNYTSCKKTYKPIKRWSHDNKTFIITIIKKMWYNCQWYKSPIETK